MSRVDRVALKLLETQTLASVNALSFVQGTTNAFNKAVGTLFVGGKATGSILRRNTNLSHYFKDHSSGVLTYERNVFTGGNSTNGFIGLGFSLIVGSIVHRYFTLQNGQKIQKQ